MRDQILQNRKKCPHCRNGKIDVEEQLQLYNSPFRNPQSPFFHLTCLDNVEINRHHDVLEFCKFAYEYNRLFQFASASLNFAQDIPRREKYNVIKINNVIHFRQSTYVPPSDRSKPASFAQIFALRFFIYLYSFLRICIITILLFRPEDIEGIALQLPQDHLTVLPATGHDAFQQFPHSDIPPHIAAQQSARIQYAHDKAKNKKAPDLNDQIIRRLTAWFAANNWLAQAYYHAREVYEHAKTEAELQGKTVPSVNFVILGQRAAQKVRQQEMDNPEQTPNLFRGTVHPHQVQVPAQRFESEFNGIYRHLAQVCFLLAILIPFWFYISH